MADLAPSVRAFLACLPGKYRQALIMVEYQGLKQHEIAERLGISLSGAKSRVQRGREMIREALLDCCHFEFDRHGTYSSTSPVAPPALLTTTPARQKRLTSPRSSIESQSSFPESPSLVGLFASFSGGLRLSL